MKETHKREHEWEVPGLAVPWSKLGRLIEVAETGMAEQVAYGTEVNVYASHNRGDIEALDLEALRARLEAPGIELRQMQVWVRAKSPETCSPDWGAWMDSVRAFALIVLVPSPSRSLSTVEVTVQSGNEGHALWLIGLLRQEGDVLFAPEPEPTAQAAVASAATSAEGSTPSAVATQPAGRWAAWYGPGMQEKARFAILTAVLLIVTAISLGVAKAVGL